MHEIVLIVLGLMGLLVLVSILPPIAARLNLPFTVLLAAAGVALGTGVAAVAGVHRMGPLGDFLMALNEFHISSEAFLIIFLPTLLFESALAIDVRRLMDDLAPILLLAVIAVVACMLAVGGALSVLSGVDPVVCMLVGAIVATTDPAAVIGVFRDVGAPRRLTMLVEGESLFNDAAAIALSTLLLAMLTMGASSDVGATTLAFLWSFLGGAVVGHAMARVACWLFLPLRGLRLAEITLTVSLAYLSFIAAESYLHVSGVVAVVTAGLTVGSVGRTRITPTTWHSLVETWEQLGFWASSLIFLLAAMLVPRLLDEVTPMDGLWVAVAVLAAFLSRGAILFGFLPVFSATGLAARVSHAFKLVIVWGGLRGAISLALVLAVAENANLAPETRRLVAVLVTGFVLFTLLVNGPSLRPLIRLLGLNRLSPADAAVRERALGMAVADIRERVAKIAAAEGIDTAAVAAIAAESAQPVGATARSKTADEDLRKEDRVYIGLTTLAARERELYLEAHRDRLVSRRIADIASAQASRLQDGVKAGGQAGYEAAVARDLGFSTQFRLALWAYHRLGHKLWLAALLADRFEILLIQQAVQRRLAEFTSGRLASLLGARTAVALAGILETRLAAVDRALAALKLQYPDYARAMQAKYLGRIALRLEEASYRNLFAESAISQEVFQDLSRRVSGQWQEMRRRPPLDIAAKHETLLGRVPLFAELTPDRLASIATLLRPRLAVPDERIIVAGDHGDCMYFIASGAVEVRLQPEPVRLGSGEFFGEIALLTHRPRMADVVALGYCQLLVLYTRDFDRLLGADPDLRARIDEVARQRLGKAD